MSCLNGHRPAQAASTSRHVPVRLHHRTGLRMGCPYVQQVRQDQETKLTATRFFCFLALDNSPKVPTYCALTVCVYPGFCSSRPFCDALLFVKAWFLPRSFYLGRPRQHRTRPARGTSLTMCAQVGKFQRARARDPSKLSLPFRSLTVAGRRPAARHAPRPHSRPPPLAQAHAQQDHHHHDRDSHDHTPDSLLRAADRDAGGPRARFEQIVRAEQDELCAALEEIDGAQASRTIMARMSSFLRRPSSSNKQASAHSHSIPIVVHALMISPFP